MKKTITIDPDTLQTPLTVLYDSAHADSAKEFRFLQSKNADGKLQFVDLEESADSLGDFGVKGLSGGELICIRDSGGQIVNGIDALYAAHAAVGLANWFAMCRLPGFLSVGTGIGPKH